MGNPAGVKRDFEALERRRLWAAKLLKQGWRQAEVARRVGVHRQSVSRWARQLGEGGWAGLKRAGSAGRKPRLTAAGLRRLERGLKRGPEALGYATSLWTTPRVAELIQRACGVQYHPAHVWRLLRQLGWSCQRAAGRAHERDEAAMCRGKQKRAPELERTPPKRANQRLRRRERTERAQRWRTGAPKGQTPVRQYDFN